MADKIELLEEFDGFVPLRNGLRRIGQDLEEWAGLPMPIEGLPLIVEPGFRNAAALAEIGKPETEPLPDDCKHRNTFYSRRWRCDVVIYEEGGEIRYGLVPAFHGMDYVLSTIGASDAWGIEQEANAVKSLAELVRHRQLKQYLLTGTFMERSRRSGVTYVFRRLRPTVALRADGEKMRVLCALCLHPIAYYDGSWAGAMCPTDDVIAMLMLMRGDEHMLWKRSNQHPAHRPEAGLS